MVAVEWAGWEEWTVGRYEGGGGYMGGGMGGGGMDGGMGYGSMNMGDGQMGAAGMNGMGGMGGQDMSGYGGGWVRTLDLSNLNSQAANGGASAPSSGYASQSGMMGNGGEGAHLEA